jgi:hypothetical protein
MVDDERPVAGVFRGSGLSVHVFCDESKAGGYRLAAVAIEAADLSGLRSLVAGFRLPRQRRVHFTAERDGRRKQFISMLTAAQVRTVIYDAPGHRSEKTARPAVVTQLADDVAAVGAARLVLEKDDSTVASNRQIIKERLAKAGNDSLRYDHQRAHEECLLSLPDAVVWCWSKGGAWRTLIMPIIDDVVMV